MHIVLGKTFDQGAYPTGLTDNRASVGRLHLGPGGFLARLEQALGIRSPSVHEPLRVAQYAKRLAQRDDGKQFYSESRKADPWRVTWKLLSLRDELISGGWNRNLRVNGSVRLRAFSELEQISAEFPLARGHPDRLLTVIERLDLLPTGIDRVELLDPPQSFSKLWRDVFNELKRRGTEVQQRAEVAPQASGDLGLAQSALLGKTASKVRGDGSLLKLETKGLIEAAEATSACLASLLRDRDPESIVLIRDGDQHSSLTLETVMRRFDIASVGLSLESSHRPATQILPLFLGLAWEPVDPDLLVQFLTLPSSPVPAEAREDFRKALNKAPGYGSHAWKEARTSVIDKIRKRYGADRAAETNQKLKDWMDDVVRIPAHREMPVTKAIQLTRQVEDWTNERAHAGETDSFFLQAKEQASIMSQLLDLHPHDTITRSELGRLLFDVLQTGVSYDLGRKEQGSINVVASPASMFDEVPVVLWWQCVGASVPAPPPRFWSEEEVRALESAGCQFLSPTDLLLDNAHAWRRPVLCAKEKLILVQPEQVFGKPQESHPIWNEVAMKVAPTEAEQLSIVANIDSLLAGKHLRAASNQFIKDSLPEGKPSWHIPEMYLKPRIMESPTSLETVLGCPLRWVLRYKAGLYEPLIGVIPERQLLYGNLAHRLVENYLKDFIGRTLPDPDTAAMTIGKRFDESVGAEAAPLIKPGMDRERIYVRQTLVDATRSLITLLGQGGYQIDSVENKHSDSFFLGPLGGRTDLIVRRARDGMSGIIDLKWSSDKRSIQALKDGIAIQLAIYSYLARTKDSWPATAYFVFPTGQLYSTNDADFPGCVRIPGPSEKETWDNMMRSIKDLRSTLDKGAVHVPCFSQDSEEETPTNEVQQGMKLEPPCKYCEFQLFCRYQ